MASLPWLSRFDVDVEWTWGPKSLPLAVWPTPLQASQESPLLLKVHDLSLFVEDGVELLPRKWTWAIWPTSVFAACQISKSWHEANDKRYTLLPTCTFQTWSWYKVDGTTLDVPSFPNWPVAGLLVLQPLLLPFLQPTAWLKDVAGFGQVLGISLPTRPFARSFPHPKKHRKFFPQVLRYFRSWDNWKIVSWRFFSSLLPLLPHRWRYCDNASWSCRGAYTPSFGRVDQRLRWQFFWRNGAGSDRGKRDRSTKVLRLRQDKWNKKCCQHMINKKYGSGFFLFANLSSQAILNHKSSQIFLEVPDHTKAAKFLRKRALKPWRFQNSSHPEKISAATWSTNKMAPRFFVRNEICARLAPTFCGSKKKISFSPRFVRTSGNLWILVVLLVVFVV